MACDEKQAAVTALSKRLVDQLETKSKALAADIKDEAKDIDPDVDTDGPDAWVGLEIEIGWNCVEFSLDLPEVTLRVQRWSLDLPQVTMKDQDIIFHTPSIRMERVKTGEYPETTCGTRTVDGPLGSKFDVPYCDVHWSPIYIDVPVPFMQEQRINMGVPEFKVDRTDVILHLPEFEMKPQSFALDLPSFRVRDIKVVAAETQEKGRKLQANSKQRADALKAGYAESAKAELGPHITDLFYCYENELSERRNAALAQFDRSTVAIKAMVTALVEQDCPADDPALVAANQNLAKVQAAREAFCKQIEEAFLKLHASQQAFFEKLVPGSPASGQQPAAADKDLAAAMARQ